MPVVSPAQMLTLFVALTLFAIPAGLVLKRMGRNPAWALLCYIPVLAMIGLWILALAPKSGDTSA